MDFSSTKYMEGTYFLSVFRLAMVSLRLVFIIISIGKTFIITVKYEEDPLNIQYTMLFNVDYKGLPKP